MTTAGPMPGEFEALVALAERERSAGRLAEAAAACRKILALRPGLAEAYNNLGNALEHQGKLDEAAAQYERALALRPSLFQAHDNLGNILRKQGKLDQAVARYEQALTSRPDLAEAYNHLGNVLKDLGKFDEAAARFEQALALRPDYVEAHFNRAGLKTFRPHDPDLAALEAIAEADLLPPDKMLQIHFALGKALDDVGEYGRAFEHLLKGNALKRREINYNEAAQQQSFRRIAESFDSRLLDRFSAVGDPSSVPIFVLGMPRSGSTLVEQILASHPQVHAAGELSNLIRVVRTVTDASGRPVPFPQCAGVLDADGWRRLGQAYLASLPTPAEGKTRITDKMPTHFAYIGLIRLILPAARIIHTMRDPVDTCVSCFSKLFTSGAPFTYDLAELGRYYRGYHELMTHWRSVLPAGAMLDVSYEDVVDNLEEQARRLIDYCGLPWDDRCLKFHETNRPIATASNVEVRRPLYRSSVARWRRYEAYLQPLLSELASCRRAE
jgi:tetratricopeptide (TPR) repeat protein